MDLRNRAATFAVFEKYPDIEAIIHFAAYKAVGESVEKPLAYYENNLLSLMNLLEAMKKFEVDQHCLLLILHRIWSTRGNAGHRGCTHSEGHFSLWQYQADLRGNTPGRGGIRFRDQGNCTALFQSRWGTSLSKDRGIAPGCSGTTWFPLSPRLPSDSGSNSAYSEMTTILPTDRPSGITSTWSTWPGHMWWPYRRLIDHKQKKSIGGV